MEEARALAVACGLTPGGSQSNQQIPFADNYTTKGLYLLQRRL